MNPKLFLLTSLFSLLLWLEIILAFNKISPLSIESIKPIKFNKVVLPDPEGPVIEINSPLSTVRLKLSNIQILSLPCV